MLERLRAAWHALSGPNPDETRFSRVGGMTFVGQGGVVRHSPMRTDQFAREGYAGNIVMYLCIRLVSDAFASLPLPVFVDDEEAPDHDAARLLRRPNPLRGRARFLQELAGYHLIGGTSWIEAVRPGKRRPPRELFVLSPRHMQIVPGPAGLPAAYRFEVPGGRHQDWPLDPITGFADVLMLREFNPVQGAGEEFGFAPTQAASRWIDMDNQAADLNNTLSRGVNPALAFVHKSATSTDQIDAARERVIQRYREAGRNADPMVMGGDWSVQKLMDSLKDMQWSEGLHESARRICAAWGVPHILVVPGESTYANREQARLELWEQCVIPLARLMLDDINPWLAWLFQEPGLEIRVDEDSISPLEPRRVSRREQARADFVAGILSLDEARWVGGWTPAEPSDNPAEEPGALRGARQAALLAEAQAQAARSPQPAAEDDEESQEEDAPPAVDDEEEVGKSAVVPFGRWSAKASDPADRQAREFADELDDEDLIREAGPTLLDTIRHFSDRVLRTLDVQISFSIFNPNVERFMRAWGTERVVGLIGPTTKKAIAETVADSIREGQGFSQVVTGIRSVFADASRLRAETIARTETTRAAGFGAQHAMELGNVERKMWLSSRDGYVRSEHVELDGNVVPADQPFRYGGDEAMYPGGFSRASLSINCRCNSIAIPDEKAATAYATKEARDLEWKKVDEDLLHHERLLTEAIRRGFQVQEQRMVVKAYRRFGVGQ